MTSNNSVLLVTSSVRRSRAAVRRSSAGRDVSRRVPGERRDVGVEARLQLLSVARSRLTRPDRQRDAPRLRRSEEPDPVVVVVVPDLRRDVHRRVDGTEDHLQPRCTSTGPAYAHRQTGRADRRQERQRLVILLSPARRR